MCLYRLDWHCALLSAQVFKPGRSSTIDQDIGLRPIAEIYGGCHSTPCHLPTHLHRGRVGKPAAILRSLRREMPRAVFLQGLTQSDPIAGNIYAGPARSHGKRCPCASIHYLAATPRPNQGTRYRVGSAAASHAARQRCAHDDTCRKMPQRPALMQSVQYDHSFDRGKSGRGGRLP